MAKHWSVDEVDMVVDVYFSMLRFELEGREYNKAEHRRGLLERIDRSNGSVEYKLANVSAALIELGGVPIDGYKPYPNMQQLLRERVADRYAEAADLRRLMMRVVDAAPAQSMTPLQTPTDVPQIDVTPGERLAPRRGRFVDYQAREAANRGLGLAGEQSVLEFERRRLQAAGLPDLAAAVRHTSAEDGDGLGYDVLSFEPNGTERFIEVKTTRFTKQLPFMVSRNEVEFSVEEPERFHLYRLFHFGGHKQGFYVLSGGLDQSAALTAEMYSGLPRPAASA